MNKKSAVVMMLMVWTNPALAAPTANVISGSYTNPMTDEVTHYVNIRSASYKEFTDEDELQLTCNPDGSSEIKLRAVGVAYNLSFFDSEWAFEDGKNVSKPTRINYRLDNEIPSEIDFADLLKPAVLSRMIKAERIVVQEVRYRHGFRDEGHAFDFPLDGLERALAEFRRQCE